MRDNISTYKLERQFSRTGRRIAPKFCTHVRIDTLTLIFLTHPTLGGVRGLCIVKNLSRRTVPKFGTHVRIDTLTLKKYFFLTHPTPGGLSEPICGDDVAMMWRRCGYDDVCGWQLYFTYLFRDTTVGPRPNLGRVCG